MKLFDVLNTNLPITCVVQGGGMRGTYSIAALAELERLGYSDRFSAIYGSSAGALNASYFLARQASEGIGIYIDYLSGKRFIDFSRIRPIIDIDYLIDDVLSTKVPLNKKTLINSQTDLYVYLTNAENGQKTRFYIQEEPIDVLMEILRATAALPIVYGKEVVIHNGRFVDGGLVDQVPLFDALNDECENILVILTRPLSFRVKTPSIYTKYFIKILSKAFGHSKGVVRLLGVNNGLMNACMDALSGLRVIPNANIWVIAPPQNINLASRLTNEKEILIKTSKQAKIDVTLALEKEKVC